MRNFSRIVARYSVDRISGILAWSSNISILFIVNSKLALSLLAEVSDDEAKMRERRETLSLLAGKIDLVFETELLN